MKKKLKETIAGVVWLSIFMIPMVFAASYSTSYSFDNYVIWITRNFDGQNIQFISRNATSTPFKHSSNYYYYVELYRDVFWPDDYIWQVTLPRDSYGVAQWSNVWPWNYYVKLSKTYGDGVTLVDNSVTFANY